MSQLSDELLRWKKAEESKRLNVDDTQKFLDLVHLQIRKGKLGTAREKLERIPRDRQKDPRYLACFEKLLDAEKAQHPEIIPYVPHFCCGTPGITHHQPDQHEKAPPYPGLNLPTQYGSHRYQWDEGCALDIYTKSSEPNGYGGWNSTRSELGQVVHDIKYAGADIMNAIDQLATPMAEFIRWKDWDNKIDVILPVPPSTQRRIQPVPKLAEKVGELLNTSVDLNYIRKIQNTEPMKNLKGAGFETKVDALKDAFDLGNNPLLYRNKNIILIDDTFGSGATLHVLANLLKEKGNVNSVTVLTVVRNKNIG